MRRCGVSLVEISSRGSQISTVSKLHGKNPERVGVESVLVLDYSTLSCLNFRFL